MGKVIIKTASGKRLLIKPIVAVRQTERSIELLRQSSETSFLKPYLAKPIIWTYCTTAFSDGVRIAMSPVFAHMMLLLGNKAKESQIEEITKAAKDDSDYNYRINMTQGKYLQYIIIHECYHALYLHIRRSLLKFGKGTSTERKVANIAMDMEINRDIEAQLPFYSGCTTAVGGIWFMDEKWKNKETNKYFSHEVWEDIYDYLMRHQEQTTDNRNKATSNQAPKQKETKAPRNAGWDKAIEAIKGKLFDPMTV